MFHVIYPYHLFAIQCAFPVFDFILPKSHNAVVMDLIFVLATWHGLTKLKMHTELTLCLLGDVTEVLGKQFHTFQSETANIMIQG